MGILQDFWDWWIAELKNLRPSSLLAAQYEPVLRIGRRTGRFLSSGTVSKETTPDELERSDFSSAKKPDIHLLLGQGRYVLRQVAERRLPYSRTLEIAAIDLADRTPFRAADVFIAPLSFPSSSGSYYVLLRKDVLDPWLSVALPQIGYRTACLGLELNGETVWLPPRSARGIDPRIGRSRWNLFTPGLTIGLLVMLTLGTFTHLIWRNISASSLLEAKIAEGRDNAVTIRKMLDEKAKALAAVEAVRARRAQAVPFARVWEELTRTLPDTAYITDLNLDASVVTFSGFAHSAAQLIPLVDASESFESPILTGPVSRVPGRTGEQFHIRATVSRP